MSAGPPIPFNRPYVVGTEADHLREAAANGHFSGNGPFCRRCEHWLTEETGSARVLMTSSCTAALEMAVLLAEIGPGDEVVMPSFTFVSTANAVALRGGVPVFVDVRPDTLNLDEAKVEAAVTPRTKAILAVHYAGVGCEMDELVALAGRRGLLLVEDAAQGILSGYHGRALGSIGNLGALSFHETKNIHCGEGGALLVNDPRFVEQAEVIHEKGTNRARFFRGEVDRYTWIELGSSYALSDLGAAFLWAQLEEARPLTVRRRTIWDTYHAAFGAFEDAGLVRRPIVPSSCDHNAHLYYLLLPTAEQRPLLIASLSDRGVHAIFHYVPLHTSPAGRRLGRPAGDLSVTEDVSDRLVRLPLWVGMSSDEIERVVDAVSVFLERSPVGVRAASP